MPKVKPLTEAGRKEEARASQRERIVRIVSAAIAADGIDKQRLSQKAGMDYQALRRKLRGESEFRITELCDIADALYLDDGCRAAICGAKEKCRFESGYNPRKGIT